MPQPKTGTSAFQAGDSSTDYRVSIRSKTEVRTIIEKITVVVDPQGREDLRRAFSSLLGPTSVEPGCNSCDLYQDAGNPNRFCLETRWKTDQELIRHLRSEQYRNLLILLELSSEPPQIEFHVVVETKGLELIHAVRRERLVT